MSEEKNSSVSETDTSGCANSSQDFTDVSTNGTSSKSLLASDVTVSPGGASLADVSDLELSPPKDRPRQSISPTVNKEREFQLSDVELTPLKLRPNDQTFELSDVELTPLKLRPNDQTFELSDVELTPLKGRPAMTVSLTESQIADTLNAVTPVKPKPTARRAGSSDGQPPEPVQNTPVIHDGQDPESTNVDSSEARPKANVVTARSPKSFVASSLDVQNGDVSSTDTNAGPAASTPESNPLKKRKTTSKARKPAGKRKRQAGQPTSEIQTPTAASPAPEKPGDGTEAPNEPAAAPQTITVNPRRRGRPPKKKPPPACGVVPPPVVPALAPTPNVSELLLPGYIIVEEIMKMGALTKPFLSRPNEKIKGMDTYYTYIAEPMWLLEVKRKLEEGLYASLQEFAHDTRLIFENCYRFNGPSNWCTKKALKVEEAFEEKIAKLPKHQATMCSLYSTHGIRREDFVTPEDIASSTDYCSPLLTKIVLENKKQLAEDQLKKESALKISVAPLEENKPQAEPETDKESQLDMDKNEIFKGMRMKLLETLTDKEIEMAVCEEEKEEELEKIRKKKTKKKKIEETPEEMPEEKMEDEDMDYLEDMMDDNADETEEERTKREEREKEDVEWEETNIYCGRNREHLRCMWELPEIAHFVCCALDVLNLEDIPLYELERMFLIPQASRGLAMLMTSLLSNPTLRPRLDQLPPMSYRVWSRKLHALVSKWYKAYNRYRQDQLTVYEIDPQFWVMMGPWNPLDEYAYHELSYHQRVWLVKALCDYCFMNQKSVLDAVVELSFSDRDYRLLGCDANGAKYFYLRPFCERDLRVYKEAADPVLWQDKHDRHLASEAKKRRGPGRPRGRRKKNDPPKQPQVSFDESTASETPPVKKRPSGLAVRRSTRNRSGFQSYEDLPDYDSSTEWPTEQESSTRLTDAERESAKDEIRPTNRESAEGESSMDAIANRESAKDESGPTNRESAEGESSMDACANRESAGNNDDCDKRLAKPSEAASAQLTCECSGDQTCTKCARRDETCDNIAQDSVKKDGDNPSESTAPSLPAAPVPPVRRPLQDPHWLAPDPDNFLLVADSVQSLRRLIDSFTDPEDMSLSERLSKKPAVKARVAEESLVSNLKELLDDFLQFETSLIRSVNRSRFAMRRQWERFVNRPANFVDKTEASWLDTSELESQSSWQTTDALEMEDATTKTETDGTLRACRARARSKPFVEDEVTADFEDQEEATQSGDESDSDAWVLPGSKRKLKAKKTTPPTSTTTPPTSPRPKKKKKKVEECATPSAPAPVPSGAEVIDLVEDDALPPLPPPLPSRPRHVLQSKHAVRIVERSDFDPDIICLSDEDDLPPPLRPKVISTSSDRPVRLEDIPRLLKTANKPSEKLTKFLQDTVKVYNESEVKAGGRTGEKVVLLPSMNEKGEFVNVKKLGGHDAAKVLANKKNTQTRHVLPVNGANVDLPSSLRIVKVCSLSQQAAPTPPTHSTPPRQIQSGQRSAFASVPRSTLTPRKSPLDGPRPTFTPPRQRGVQVARGSQVQSVVNKTPVGRGSNQSPAQYRAPPEGHMVTTPQGQKVYLLQQRKQSPQVSPERRVAKTISPKARVSTQKLYAEATPPRQNAPQATPLRQNAAQTTPPRLHVQQTTPPRQNASQTTPPRLQVQQATPPRQNVTQATPPRLQMQQAPPPHQQQFYAQNTAVQYSDGQTQMSSPGQNQMMMQGQQPTHLVLQRVPPPNQAPPPQQRVLVTYAPQQTYTTQPQIVYPQTVSNPATGILHALANRQSYVQQQTVQSYQMVGGDQYATQGQFVNQGQYANQNQYAVMSGPVQYQENTVIIRQSTYVSAPVYAAPQQTYAARQPVVTISDDSDEGGEAVVRPKLIFVLDDTGPQYARVLPNGDRVILSAGELAKIRQENGGVLPI